MNSIEVKPEYQGYNAPSVIQNATGCWLNFLLWIGVAIAFLGVLWFLTDRKK